MGRVIGRVVLGICAAAGFIGGGGLVLEAAAYFYAGQFLHVPRDFGELLAGGTVALGIFTGGAFRAHVALRIAAGVAAAAAGFVFTGVFGVLVSEQGNDILTRNYLESGAFGVIWFVAGFFFFAVLMNRRWPVGRRPGRDVG